MGRSGELDLVDAALDSAIGGRAAALLLIGEPGIGKTAVLETARTRATALGMTTVWVTCLQSEESLPGATLGLVRSRLTQPAGRSGPASLLEALAAAAVETPLLLVIDDVQWLDEASRAGLTFAVRRLLADSVAVLLGGRPEVGRWRELSEVPVCLLEPLPEAEAVALLQTTAPDIRPDLAHDMARALGCLPIALVEAGNLLTPDEQAGRVPLPRPPRVGSAVQELFAAGFASLPDEVQLAVTVLAADDSGDAGGLAAALASVATGPTGLASAERVGLVTLGVPPSFAHPLGRSAVFAAASPTMRRRAHEVLARVAEERGDSSGALRHASAAAIGPDEDLAGRLETEAAHLAQRGAPGQASSLAELAATLSPNTQDRRRRLVAAAETALDPSRTDALISDVLEGTEDSVLLARCLLALTGPNGPGLDRFYFDRLIARINGRALPGEISSRLVFERVWQAMHAADLAQLEELAQTLGEEDSSRPWEVTSTIGVAYVFLGDHRRGEALLRRALAETASLDPDRIPLHLLHAWMFIPGWLGSEGPEHERRMRIMVGRLRGTGLPRPAAGAAFFAAERARRAGQWNRSEALFTESLELSEALEDPAPTPRARLASLLVARGQAARAEQLIAQADVEFESSSTPDWNRHWLPATRGALALTRGDAELAVELLTPVTELPFVGRGARDMVAQSGIDLVEALSALGRHQVVAAAHRLACQLDGCSDPLALGFVERSRGLADPSVADDALAAAVTYHEHADDPFELARSQLLLGEHLRRTRRSSAARTPLRAAASTFEGLGARPWATRAAREARAAGGPVQPIQPGSTGKPGELTPQELRVAMAIADGMTNNEAAAALFLSAKTIEFHLGRVYRKLGVRARGGLARALDASRT